MNYIHIKVEGNAFWGGGIYSQLTPKNIRLLIVGGTLGGEGKEMKD